ncbi:MAG: hypothetical protein HYR55_18075 [Acidobacteria bacterium]|nr:hypothetical protein [Acidobacteriota bacterium]MBI3658498.1 hypothetical protein [Acidobacteriota bacterium]
MMLGNQLITRKMCLHYRDGIPLGTVGRQLDGTAVQMLHRLAAVFKASAPL